MKKIFYAIILTEGGATIIEKIGENEREAVYHLQALEFIEDVKVTILASGQGMKITLLDQDDNEIRKESLSSAMGPSTRATAISPPSDSRSKWCR